MRIYYNPQRKLYAVIDHKTHSIVSTYVNIINIYNQVIFIRTRDLGPL